MESESLFGAISIQSHRDAQAQALWPVPDPLLERARLSNQNMLTFDKEATAFAKELVTAFWQSAAEELQALLFGGSSLEGGKPRATGTSS